MTWYVHVWPNIITLIDEYKYTNRYSVDIDLKKTVDEASVDIANRVETRKAVKKIFEVFIYSI